MAKKKGSCYVYGTVKFLYLASLINPNPTYYSLVNQPLFFVCGGGKKRVWLHAIEKAVTMECGCHVTTHKAFARPVGKLTKTSLPFIKLLYSLLLFFKLKPCRSAVSSIVWFTVFLSKMVAMFFFSRDV